MGDFVKLHSQTLAPFTKFDHYCGHGDRLKNFCLFVYIQVVNVILRKLERQGNIQFVLSYLNYYTHIQQHFTKLESKAEVKLLSQLFDCNSVSEVILTDLSNITEDFNNIIIILLALFMP